MSRSLGEQSVVPVPRSAGTTDEPHPTCGHCFKGNCHLCRDDTPCQCAMDSHPRRGVDETAAEFFGRLPLTSVGQLISVLEQISPPPPTGSDLLNAFDQGVANERQRVLVWLREIARVS